MPRTPAPVAVLCSLVSLVAACTVGQPERSAFQGPLDAVAKGGKATVRWEAAYAGGLEPWHVFEYPAAPRGTTVDVIHGRRVPDPYRWMEDPADPRLMPWVREQQALMASVMDHASERSAYQRRLTELWDHPRYGTPVERGGRYFFTRNDGLQNQSVLMVADGLGEEGRVLLDPNQWSEGGTISLAGWFPSEDGRLLAYAQSEGGSDWRTIRVMDVASGEDQGVRIDSAKFTGVSWAKDASGFYYSRYPEKPQGAAELTALNENQKVYFHRRTPEGWVDELVWESPEHPRRGWGASLTDDGRFLVLTGSETTAPVNLLYVDDLADEQGFVPIVTEFRARYSVLGVAPAPADAEPQQADEQADQADEADSRPTGQRLLVYTTDGAPLGRVIAIDPANPARESWEEVIPEGDIAIQGASMVGGHVITEALRDVLPEVRVYTPAGELVRTVDLPGIGSVSGFGGRQSDEHTYYTFSSFAVPPTQYRYHVASGTSEVFRESEVDFDGEPFVTRQLFYESKDGTRVPMFITHREGIELDGSHKLLLYGYGGFGIPLTPRFSLTRASWLESGGIYAVANLRGGNEYGLPWRQAGSLLEKQNTFDDFIAAAEHLQSEGYTAPERTAIMGGSNGGLLVGACVTQRPELFAAAIPQVGVLDMLRFHLFSAGRFWVSDYGSAEDPEQFEALLRYSPYHNVELGTRYPATMVTTAFRDDRVVPMHSFKFAAALQWAQGGPEPILIRVETDAGHGAGAATEKTINQYADIWAFLDMVMAD